MTPSARERFGLVALFSFLLAFAGVAEAQTPSLRAKQQRGKPVFEKSRRRLTPRPPASRAAPPGPVHSVAEWEESEGVMTLWWNWDLVDELQQRVHVYIPVDDQSEKDSWTSYLGNHGVPMANVEFLTIPTDTIYTRDFGPWFIWDANDDLGIVNYTCGYGYWDDLFPQHFAARFGIDFYESGINHVGGNWYPNAWQTAFSTTLVYTQNGDQTMAETDAAMRDYYGIERYNTVVVAPWTIEHHDCWGKPADPETMLVAEFAESSEYHPYGELVNDHYETLESPWGRPYEVIRIPMFKMGSGWFEFRPYLNALISNEAVYVAITGHPDDQIALAVFQQAYPGYEIVGVDHGGTGFNDALHCRTRNFYRRDAIRLYPVPPGDTEDSLAGYPVTAEVIPPKGWALQSGYPKVRWSTTGGAPFSDLVMAATGAPDEYGTTLPAQPQGTEVSFYVEALDDGGRSALYPMVAPDGLMSFEVRADLEAPVLSRFIPTRSASAGQWPPAIRTLCKDDMAAPQLRVEWAVNGVPRRPIDLSREELCYWYEGELTGAASAGDLVTYRLVATDGAAIPNEAVLPRKGEVFCPVVGPGSVAVVDLSRRPFSGPVAMETLGSLGIPCTRYTSWPADWSEHEVWFILLGVYADNHILTASQANDVVAALQAGNRIYLEGGDTWCYDDQKDVLCPWFKVDPISDGEDLEGGLDGQAGTMAAGLHLEYAGTNAFMDEIGALAPAEVVFRSGSDDAPRVVAHDGSSYRTIASTFALGALLEGAWPETGKEVLLRYLDFLGVGGVQLKALASARPGTDVPIRLEGTPGHEYVLLEAWAEDYLQVPGYGVLRLAKSEMSILRRGTIPPSGAVLTLLPVPADPALVGSEIHVQAVVGASIAPGQAALTNREILTIR